MAKAKPPYMPLYGKDAWSDEDFLAAEWDTQGLFWRLAWWQWQEGSIPDDLKKVLNVIGKPHSTKRLWPLMKQFFVPHPELAGRLYHEKVDELRQEALGEKEARVRGANITNAKLGRGTLSDTLSDTLNQPSERPGQRIASRVATANATANAFESEGVQGEPSLPPDFDAVARLMPRFEQVGLKVLPPEQVVVGWVQDFGEQAVLDVLAKRDGDLRGKHYTYLQPILMDPKGKQRESRSKSDRKPHGNPTAKEFGMRSIDDVLADKRGV